MMDENHPRVLRMQYTNYRGETRVRTITPMETFWGSNKYHPAPQHLLRAFDHDKNAVREFALADCNFTKTSEE